ncbi:MAG TPA: sulfatase [Bacteroidales bacterium]|nr:sulfatase [Bacteroidales bacterium]HPF03479.1 sulfatase [Bacteroidales bacterium]HPJ59010.1 sulfatase [Bacteroidales bacterium]HPR11159.1 sulfatase [Bacteroidales bacterium]HRW86055.1 sulfatase [Bacteroidales bacterium]
MLSLKLKAGAVTLAMIPMAAGLNSCSNSTEKPNVIFILLDDMGYTDLGCYGSTFYETPNIDRLASEGIRFTDAYASCPVSSPTRSSIMTGKYTVRTGITDWIPGRQATKSGLPDDKLVALPFNLNLSLDEVTLAEALKQNGYRTMISGKWHLGETEEFWPEHQGFDVNSGGFSKGSPVRNKTANGYFSPYGNPRLEDGPEGEYLTDRQTDDAIKFIEETHDDPFFVYLSYYAVHNPMQAKEEHTLKFSEKAASVGLDGNEAFTRERDWIRPEMSNNFKERIIQSNPVYAGMIWSVDENIGKLINKLKELKIYDNTIIIFTSDNGGLSTSEGSPTCNAPLRAGKGWLYEGGIRVPLIIRHPSAGKAGTTEATPVSSIDFFPTIMDMTASVSPVSDIDGVSIFPLLTGAYLPERPLFWHYPHYSNQGVEPGSAVRLGKYKLIDNFERERLELYDLQADISETNDISVSNPEKKNELYNLLTQWRKKNNTRMMLPNPAWKNRSLPQK